MWFQSHNTCHLCHTCQTPPINKASREEHGGNAKDGEQVEAQILEGINVIEMVIDRNTEHDRSRSITILEFL